MSTNTHTKITRLYGECEKALDESRSREIGEAIINRFNHVLDEVQRDHPDNQTVQNVEKAEPTGAGIVAGAPPRPRADDLQRVKFRLETLSDALGFNIHGFPQPVQQPQPAQTPAGQPNIIVNNYQNQSQQQSATQTITVEEIRREVEDGEFSDDERERLLELLDEFSDELESEDPDEGRLRDAVNSAKALSLDVGAKMLYLALENNIDAFGG
ncbi:hypothetical protein GRS48_12625 [Halorubrum sp. JWXQ-INN 858]|uniref:hypothetical protein n=1 Tax=Halorubrum sp. JWXQ-INN 858 TaxID=2690782 RepID=UPI001357B4C2|nr:hypothetical protein [Halorubrum sp. JWXQ-INN 858]MWV65657.1 hypothetical protein [Halorubrum sp. JWXQ-INN 858]